MDEKQKDQAAPDPLEGCPEQLLPVVKGLQSAFADVEFGLTFFRGEVTVTVSPDKSKEVLTYLKGDFDYLIDVGGLHEPKAENPFQVFYNLLSLSKKLRLRVKTWAVGEPPTVNSAVSIWEGANWYEREAYDMFGILFEGHPDHRRMFLPEHVDIHPLRKEYPLRGDNDKPTW